MIYIKLILSFFQIGLFSIGGGYAALPLIQQQVVEINHWLTMEEFTDLITISQMTPGPIAINSATFVGNRIGGITGAVFATFGFVLPSLIIVLLLAFIYSKFQNIVIIKGILEGLRPAVVALIAAAGVSILITSFWGEQNFISNIFDVNVTAVGIFILCLFVLRKFKFNPILVMMGSGVAGMILYLSIG